MADYKRLANFEQAAKEGHKYLFLIENWQDQTDKINQFLAQTEESMDQVEIFNPLEIYQLPLLLQYQKSQSKLLQALDQLPPYFTKLMTSDALLLIFHFDKELSADDLKIRIESLQYLADKYQLPHWQGGMPFVNYHLNRHSEEIRDFYFPIIFLACFFLLLLILQSFRITALIFIPSLASSILSLAFIKLFFGPMNMITAIAPVMIFILNLAIGLHLSFTYSLKLTWLETWKKKKKPIILMLTTTAIGLFSLTTSNIEAIKQFGLSTGSLLLLTGLWHLSWVKMTYPVFFKAQKLKILMPHWLVNYFSYPIKLAYAIPIMIILATSGLIAGKLIPFETEATHYFPAQSEETLSLNKLSQSSIGLPLFELLITVDQSPWENWESLKKIEVQETEIIEAMGRLNPALKILSPLMMIREAQFHLTQQTSLPPDYASAKPVIASIQEKLKEQYATNEFYRLTIFGPSLDQESFDLINQKLLLLNKDYPQTQITGKYYALRTGQNSLLETLLKSLLATSLLMALIAGFYFKKTKTVLSFLAVNILPLITSLIFFKLFAISFNIATVMTFSVALGMIVDGSLHMTFDIESNTSLEDKLTQTIFPLVLGSLIPTIAFFILAFNKFLPIREFGLALGITLLIGLFYDLAILPRLLGVKAKK